MKPTKLMLGAMVLSLGIAGAAWAQPAPNHDRDAVVRGGYTIDHDYVNHVRGYRDDVYRYGYNPYVYQRGDGDHDRDDRGEWRAPDDRNDGHDQRGDHDARSARKW